MQATGLLINPRNHPAIANALLYLASRCDGAVEDDGTGFNGRDSQYGKSLALQVESGRALSRPQQTKALKMLKTYANTQLKTAKIALPTEDELLQFFGPKIDELLAYEVLPGVWTVDNVTKGHTYEITHKGGKYFCDCPASLECKHIKHVRGLSTPPALDNVIDLQTKQPIAEVTLPEPVLIEAPVYERVEVAEPWEEGLTLDQKRAVTDIVLFGMGRTAHKMHVLTGSAGTGKTFTLQRGMMAIQSLTDNIRPVFTAPSHKAVNVMRTMANRAGQSKVDFATVASATHHRVDYDDDGKQVLVFNQFSTGPHISEYSFAVVDEASMIGEGLYKALHGHRLPILFVGDRCQLPPVNEDESPTLQLPNRSELTQIMRYSGAIGELAGAAREMVERNTRRRPVITTAYDNNEKHGVWEGALAEWQSQLIRAYKAPGARHDKDFARVLAWRNSRVDELNQMIRNSIYGEDAPTYVVGERLMAKNSVIQETEGIKRNGETYVRDEVIMNSCTECVIDSIDKDFDGDFSVWRLEVTDDLGDVHTVTIPADESWDAFCDKALKWRKELQEQKKSGQKPNWSKYYSWLNNYTVYTPSVKAKPMKSLQYAYALTVHQSQGSTFQNCFVDLPDILKNAAPEKTLERNRMIYTAFTRASKRLLILT